MHASIWSQKADQPASLAGPGMGGWPDKLVPRRKHLSVKSLGFMYVSCYYPIWFLIMMVGLAAKMLVKAKHVSMCKWLILIVMCHEFFNFLAMPCPPLKLLLKEVYKVM